jgi:hypothetical protein
VSLVESDDNSFLSSLIEAADEAYQKTSDESLPSLSAAAQVHAGPGRMANHKKNINNRPARFNLRKRKVVSVSGTSCAGAGSLSAVNSDFLSGLFADLEQTASTDTAATATAQEDEEHYVTDGESCPNTPVPSPRKRARLGRTLSRCTKSYASLSSVLRTNSTDSYVEKFQDAQRKKKIGGSNKAAPPTLPACDDELTGATTTTQSVASDVLADSLTAAAALADAVFPHLPHTVSDSPLRSKSPKASSTSSASTSTSQQDVISADLTAQPSASSTEASSGCVAEPLHVAPEMTLAEAFFATAEADGPASAAVTPTEADPAACESSSGEGDSFGWFLDLDTPTDASEEHITDAYSGDGNGSSSSSLAFQAPVSVSNHDAEVEWAKAADTVDDVLGDLPF